MNQQPVTQLHQVLCLCCKAPVLLSMEVWKTFQQPAIFCMACAPITQYKFAVELIYQLRGYEAWSQVQLQQLAVQ